MENTLQVIDAQSLIQQAVDKGNIDVVERLLDMRERIQKEQAESVFREELAAFQKECPTIRKIKKVLNKDGTTRYRYAPLDHIIKVAKPFLTAHGFSYSFDTNMDGVGGSLEVIFTLSHVLGGKSVSKYSAKTDPDAYMNEPQKWASACTFAKRYAFQNGTGVTIVDEDDDGRNAGVDHKTETKEQQAAALEAMTAQLNTLPADVQEGLRLLNYTVKTAHLFCEKFEWNPAKIKFETNKILDSKGGLDGQ